MALKRVLSIQSHVVHGYVGNKSATFPLQLLGFDVDCINSVQFCNHTGYEVVKGQILNDEDLENLFSGLEQNGLLKHYTHLLTGYIGSSLFLRKIHQIITKLKEINPNLIYVCDPVMGDEGQMYVPKELLPIYKDEIIPLADIITPNQYELELLCETPIKCEADIWKNIEFLHKKNINTIVISSADCGKSNEIISFLSSKNENIKNMITIPKQGDTMKFTGTGDLFAALFLAHSYQQNLTNAFEKTINTLQDVIRKTLASLPKEILNGERDVNVCDKELKIIQSKGLIESPSNTLKAICL